MTPAATEIFRESQAPSIGIRSITDVDDAVVDALITLGYSVVEAQTALQTIPKDTPDDVEAKLRVALQYFDHF